MRERRLKQNDIIAGLDIGSSKVRIIVAEPDGEQMKIVGIGTAPCDGVRRGIIVNLEKTIEAIGSALHDAESMAGVELNSVFVAIGGDHIRSLSSRGVIGISRASGEITHSDIARAIDAARAIAIPMDREIIHTIPLEFTVDDQPGIKDPTGFSGVRLEVEAYIVTASVTLVQNLYRAVKKAGLDVKQLVLTPLASAEAVLSEDEKELGCLLIDFGGGTNDLAVFYDGSIRHAAVIELGGKSITNDIAIGLRTPLENAEALKLQFGCALSTLVNSEDKIPIVGVGGRASKEISRSVLTAIIEPRAEEIFGLALRDLRRTHYAKTLATGIVLTGGGAAMPGIIELCEQIFDMPVKVGRPRGFTGLMEITDDPGNSTGLGLILYGMKQDQFDSTSNEGSILEKILGPFLRIFGIGKRP